jgi:two-component system phosphate regulon sensor histidine kinase PhoR
MSTKNDQIETLTELNHELENYFRNTIIPQLYIDGDEISLQTPPMNIKWNGWK